MRYAVLVRNVRLNTVTVEAPDEHTARALAEAVVRDWIGVQQVKAMKASVITPETRRKAMRMK
jgi:hypothetical protein